MKFKYPLIAILLILCACNNEKLKQEETNTTTQAPSKPFNPATSDQKAIDLADAVMQAMGGQKKWDELQYLSWNFFKVRDLVWDKWNNRVRIDFPRDSSIYLLDMNKMEGKVWRYGQELTHPDSLSKYLEIAKNIWINDSYWLVMPFKLKDPGVTLKYLRQDTTQAGIPSEVVQLTFENVGKTPENKYEVFIDKSDMLVKQWSFYGVAEQEKPSAVWPWDNYKSYDGLMLSSDRSDNRGPFKVKVHQSLPKGVFEDLNFNVNK